MMPTKEVLRESPLWREIEREGEMRGRALAEAEGWAEGWAEGQIEILRRIIEGRFGPLPQWAEERLKSADAAAIDTLVVRLYKASSLAALFD